MDDMEWKPMEEFQFDSEFEARFEKIAKVDKDRGVVLKELLGQGGFAKVYKCLYLGKTHVVKKIQKPRDRVGYKMMYSEFLVLTTLKHPCLLNLVRCYMTKTDINFILKFMKNGSLENLLDHHKEKSWKLHLPDMLVMFTEMASGIKYLHENGVLHRDVKPENILIDENFRCKVADFGVAKFVHSQDELNHTNIGTILYMAPEIFQGKKYNQKVDIWGLGMIFYEMAMLKYPFSTAQKERILNPLLTYEVPKIDFEDRKYPPELQDILNLMLQRDPRKRAEMSVVLSVPILNQFYYSIKKEEKKMNAYSSSP